MILQFQIMLTISVRVLFFKAYTITQRAINSKKHKTNTKRMTMSKKGSFALEYVA